MAPLLAVFDRATRRGYPGSAAQRMAGLISNADGKARVQRRFRRGLRLRFGRGARQQTPVAFGVPSRDVATLTALAEFLERVNPRRL